MGKQTSVKQLFDLRLAHDALIDDAQRHSGIIDFERLAGAMLAAHRRRPGVSLPGVEMRAELGVAVACSDIPATAAAASRRGRAAPFRPLPNPATDDPDGACPRPRTGDGRAPPRSAPRQTRTCSVAIELELLGRRSLKSNSAREADKLVSG
jgi:hypothetical protein